MIKIDNINLDFMKRNMLMDLFILVKLEEI
jgi:hypothetical protein